MRTCLYLPPPLLRNVLSLLLLPAKQNVTMEEHYDLSDPPPPFTHHVTGSECNERTFLNGRSGKGAGPFQELLLLNLFSHTVTHNVCAWLCCLCVLGYGVSWVDCLRPSCSVPGAMCVGAREPRSWGPPLPPLLLSSDMGARANIQLRIGNRDVGAPTLLI